MKDMVKIIKYNRLFISLDKVINSGTNSYLIDTDYYFHKYDGINYFLFYISSDVITVNYRNLILLGVDEKLSETEIKQYLYERFSKGNKKE